ncbi:MAG TPA: PxKF domain-containing protein [Candidatus Limnocylindrales bacterium]|nr:PxKF domain-containing protein [Candidatus Limnocylindrales bacterium]
MTRYRTLVSRSIAVAAVAALMVTLAGPVAAAESTTSVPVGITPCEGEVPLCNPAQHFDVTTSGTLRAQVAADATNCVAIVVLLSVDGTEEYNSGLIAPGASTGLADLGPVTPGTHTLSVEALVHDDVACPTRGWSGQLAITTSDVATDDVAVVAPGGSATVSTAVAGSPRPAGVTATLFRSVDAAGTARISVATYDSLPAGVPPNPIREAAFLDLQLENGDAGDVIAGEFLPPSPILPPNPVLPPNPIVPPNPILPPNPIRLAYWIGTSWAPVFGSGGALPTYSSVASAFSVTFDSTSSPAVTALGGTVFAIVPGYYFRGFGTPVDSGAVNVARAGRVIPLKWQVFDFEAQPVLDLDPNTVRVTSIQIACDGSSLPSDPVDEYAKGASGLQNLGAGAYQLNWASSKSSAGSCRRLQLDLGERNPDGTPFYRTADFEFRP